MEKKFKKAVHHSIIFLIVFYILFGGVLANINVFIDFDDKVKADGPVPGTDCSENWPSWPAGHECWIRGILEPFPLNTEYSTGAGCWITHKIYYHDGSGMSWRFCLAGGHSHPLTNQDTIMQVRFNSNGSFVVLQQLQSYENYNQKPLQPNLHRPQALWRMGPRTNGSYAGVSCNTAGTGGGCSVEFRVTIDDPDFYKTLTSTFQVTSSWGGTQSFSINNVEGTHSRTRTLSDGVWQWRGQSCDPYICSGWTTWRTNMIVDTTAPSVPNMVVEPAFSPGMQNNVVSTISTDNLVGGVQYYFEAATDAGFTNVINVSGWIDTNSFTFAALTNETQYFYRARARDDLWNESKWGTSTSSIQDSKFPQINSVDQTQDAISPMNTDGDRDTTEIFFEYSEKYKNLITINIVGSGGTTVRTITEDISSLPQDESLVTYSYIWDGKDDGGNYVVDDAYNINISVTDQAGNKTVDDTLYVVVDNTPATLNINQADGSWYNFDILGISGQTENTAILQISNLTTGEVQNPIPHPDNGLFGTGNDNPPPPDPIIEFGIELGENIFDFIATDLLGNVNNQTFNYYREQSFPTININSPPGLINSTQPTITLNLTDYGYNDGVNDYISGIDESSVQIYLKHNDSAEQQIVTNGLSVSPLGAVTSDCSTSGIFGSSGPESCTFSFVFNSNLQPDGNYTVRAEANDGAGNAASSETLNFELDSHILSNITGPTDGSQYNYSLVEITGEAERYSTLVVSVPDMNGDGNNDSLTIIIDPNDPANDTRVDITNCRASGNPTQDGIKEVCGYKITDFQLEKDAINPGNVTNPISFELTDIAGNIDTQTITVNVDLYAVNLSIDSDLEYFSPNGDGRQDGVEFIDIFTDGVISTGEVLIADTNGDTVKSFDGGGTPPENIPWDGRNEAGDFVPDGEYEFKLIINTTDGITFETIPQIITAVTELTDKVIITYPGNDTYTTRGVTTVQGQAPANTTVRICADVIGISGTCDVEMYSEVDGFGSFSVVMPLYRLPNQSLTEHYLTATATDKYGNTTLESNTVKITVTIKDPFEEVSIIPAFTGVNNETEYQIIVDKLNNGEEITQADIDSLRSVVFRSVVNQGTERVKMGYADRTNLDALPPGLDFSYLGYIDDNNQTYLYVPFTDGVTPYNNCSTPTCTWDFYYPVPPIAGGLYEISFEGKIGSTVQTLTAPLTIDGNIPLAPIILDVDKVINGEPVNTNVFDNIYYSNSEIIVLKGFADPLANMEVFDQNGNTICTTQASLIGMWSCETDISSFYDTNNTEVTLNLQVNATLGANTVSSLEETTVVIDKIRPNFETLQTPPTQWRNSGDLVEVDLKANEFLAYAKHIDKDPKYYVEYIEGVDGTNSDCLNGNTTFSIGLLDIEIQLGKIDDLVLKADQSEANGAYTVHGYAVEGRYCSVTEIQDRAGNRNAKPLVLFIDNTEPDKPTIDPSDWGLYNGIFTELGFIAEGRTNPEYVHEEDGVKIIGLSEEEMTIEFYVDGTKRGEQVVSKKEEVANNKCLQSIDQDTGSTLEVDDEKDTVIVENNYQCPYEFEFKWDKGEKGYYFQVITVDLAGNRSIISEDEVIYYDITPPRIPEVNTISSASYNPVPTWYIDSNYGITKDLGVKIKTYGETRADSESWYYDKNGSQIEYKFTRNPDSGFLDQNFKLGSQSDDRNGCIQMINGRRTGICEDGNYSFKFKHTDAAGNPSAVRTGLVVERDTVRPEKPELSEPYICDRQICIDASGEPDAQLISNSSTVGNLSLSNQVYTLVNWWAYDSIYTFEINVRDGAENESETITKSFKTPERPIGGGIDGASSSDPHAGQKGSEMPSITMDVKIKLKDGSYDISNINIPAPKLTFTTTSYEKKVDIFGVGIPKNHKIESNVVVEYMTKKEAGEYCQVGYIIDGDERKCMEEVLGMSLWDYNWEINKQCGYVIPIYTALCIRDKESEYRKTENIGKREFTAQHVMITFENSHDESNYSYLGTLWNDDTEGKFQLSSTISGNLKQNDSVRSHVSIFGEVEIQGIRIDYRGTNQNEANKNMGLISKNSNILKIDPIPQFKDVVVSPVKNCSSVGVTSYYGNRKDPVTGVIKFHSGVDLAQWGGCDISAVYKGEATTEWYAGNTVSIKHDDRFTTKYGHAAYYHGSYPRNVKTGENVMYMGQSGYATGIHLHFEVKDKVNNVNPWDHFGKFFDKLPIY